MRNGRSLKTACRELRKQSRGLVRIGVVIDTVLASPLVRTRQTAEIVAAAFDPKPSVVSVESLAPGGAHAASLPISKSTRSKPRIAIVGHEPGIGEFAARLIGTRHPVTFKKGAVCRIDLDVIPSTGPGELRWFLTPRALRAIKK